MKKITKIHHGILKNLISIELFTKIVFITEFIFIEMEQEHQKIVKIKKRQKN